MLYIFIINKVYLLFILLITWFIKIYENQFVFILIVSCAKYSEILHDLFVVLNFTSSLYIFQIYLIHLNYLHKINIIYFLYLTRITVNNYLFNYFSFIYLFIYLYKNKYIIRHLKNIWLLCGFYFITCGSKMHSQCNTPDFSNDFFFLDLRII